MTIALVLVSSAFSRAGIIAAEVTLSAQQSAKGLELLNDLLGQWNAEGTLEGVPPVMNLTDDLQEDRHVTRAIKWNLAIEVAGEYEFDVTQVMAAGATSSLNSLISIEMDLSDVDFPDTLPKGAGNAYHGDGWDEDFFSGTKERNF
jgi:hypothetical protein